MKKKQIILTIIIFCLILMIGGIYMAYGFSEGKGKQEVYTKNDFAVIEGTISGYVLAKSVSYPEGFNLDNTVVVSTMYCSKGDESMYSYGEGANSDSITLSSDGFSIYITNPTPTTSVTYNYKIVLMKIS